MEKNEEMEFELEEDDGDRSSGAKENRRVKRKVKAQPIQKPKEVPKAPEKKKHTDRSDEKKLAEESIQDDEERPSKKVTKVKKYEKPKKDQEDGASMEVERRKKKRDPEEDEKPENEEDDEISLDTEEESSGSSEDEGEVFEEELFEEEVPEKPKVAKKMAVDDSVKKRLLRDSRDIARLKDQIIKLKIEMQGFENEIEYVEREMEKVRSEKEGMDEEMNKKVAIINALEKKLNRTQKDFDGYKGRINQEIERKAVMKMKGMVMGVIEILDNFDRALSEGRRIGGDETFTKLLDGMDSIRKNHTKLLMDNNIVLIEPGEEQFDPHFHEAVETMNDPDKKDNTIVRVDTSGYMLEGKVLRPARVIVSKGGPPWPKKKAPEHRKSDGEPKDEEVGEVEKAIDDLEELEELVDSNEE